MNEDDPRHGTNAGEQAHQNAGEQPCPSCKAAATRYLKRWKFDRAHGQRRMIPLGEHRHAILMTSTPRTIARATGLSEACIIELRREGPTRLVYRSTVETILNARLWTPIGIQRRLRALSCLGWSMAKLCAETGLAQNNLGKLLNKERIKFVRQDTADAIVTFYDAHQTMPERDRWTIATTNKARRKGWLPPLAYDDDIDDPSATPTTTPARRPSSPSREIDTIVVERLLRGERISATKAEQEEAVRRVMADPGRTLVDFAAQSHIRVRSIAERLHKRTRRAA